MDKKKKIMVFGTICIVCIFLLSLVIANPPPRAFKECRDGIDNDGDGYTDWPSDPGCSSKNDVSELNSGFECDDGIDNDADGYVDSNDGGCSGPTDNDETNCGDSVCEGAETQESCPEDCGYPNSCSDTDGGFVLNVEGTVNGYLNDEYYNHTDFCLDNLTISEYYCRGAYATTYNISCISNTTFACSDGKCI